MPEQFSLLDSVKAERRRERGIKSTSSNNSLWMAAALTRLTHYLKTRREIRLEEFRAIWLAEQRAPPISHHAWGALARIAANQGLMTPGGYTKSTSVKTHRHPVLFYWSNVYEVKP